MSSSRKALERALRVHRIGDIPLFSRLSGQREKNTERLLGLYRRDELVKTLPYIGKRKLYTLTPKGARRLGLDPRKHRRAPGVQTIIEHVFVGTFCAQHEKHLLLPAEFDEEMPEVADLPGNKRRYFIDPDGIMCLIVPDYGLVPRELARKARKAIDERKRSGEAWMRIVKVRRLRIYVVTPYGERKAKRVEKHLRIDTFPHVVCTIELPELFPARTC